MLIRTIKISDLEGRSLKSINANDLVNFEQLADSVLDPNTPEGFKNLDETSLEVLTNIVDNVMLEIIEIADTDPGKDGVTAIEFLKSLKNKLKEY